MTALDELRALAVRPLSELRGRANALPEFLERLNALVATLAIEQEGRETSAEIANIASKLLRQVEPEMKTVADAKEAYRTLLAVAQRVAGSALAQYEPQLPDPRQSLLPIEGDSVAERAISDAIRHGQALPVAPIREPNSDA